MSVIRHVTCTAEVLAGSYIERTPTRLYTSVNNKLKQEIKSITLKVMQNRQEL